MVWIIFIISAAVVTLAATKLAEYADVIAVRTRLGGLLVGSILLAGATSIPELITSVSAFRAGEPNLAAGNFFGSNMVNIALLAVVDLGYRQAPLLRQVAITHSLMAALATVLMLVATISMMIGFDLTVGWVGVDSLIIIALYLGGLWLMQRETRANGEQTEEEETPAGFPSLRRAVLGFVIAGGVVALAVPQLVESTLGIAEITGLSTGFVGTALLSFVTSLPELITAIAAVRLGALDLAVGNLLGSSAFNMFGAAVADFFLLDGPFLAHIDPNFVLVLLFAMLLTNMALMGNLARVERKFLFFELDSVAIVVVYFLGMYVLYVRGIGV